MGNGNYRAANSATLPNVLSIMLILATMLLSYIPGGNFITIGVGLALFLVTFLFLISGQRELWISSEIVAVLVWLAYSLIPSVFAPNQEEAMFKAMSMSQLLVLALVMLQVSIWQKSTRPLAWAYIIAVCTSYVITFTALNELVISSQADVGGIDNLQRTASTLGNANTFGVAAVLGQSLVVLLLSLHTTRGWERLLATLCFFVLAGAVVNSGSRTALVGMFILIIGMAWVFSLWKPQRLIPFIKWILILSAIVGAAVYVLKDIEEVRDRFELVVFESKIEVRIEDFVNLVLQNQDEGVERSGQSIEDRMNLVSIAWDVANQYPFGVGLNNFAEISGVYAHSNYMELLATTGFIGVLLYYISYIIVGMKSLRLWINIRGSDFPKAIILGIVVLAAMDIANVSYYSKPVWLFLIIMIGTAELYRRQMVGVAKQNRQRDRNV